MKPTKEDPWKLMKTLTHARIGMGRSGGSLTTDSLMKFRLDHAMARAAVWKEWDLSSTQKELNELGYPTLQLQSQAADKETYLQRPDLGKRLNSSSVHYLKQVWKADHDLGIVISEGLSSYAIEQQTIPFLKELLPMVPNYQIAPIVLVKYGRVAIGDEIGELLKCKLVIILIGERPGLSSPDSLGIYLTYHPKKGTTDEKRNCISNIHPAGLSYQLAAEKLFYLCNEAIKRKLTGVELKDDFSKQIE